MTWEKTLKLPAQILAVFKNPSARYFIRGSAENSRKRGRHFVHLLSTSEVDKMSTSPKTFYLSPLKTGPTILAHFSRANAIVENRAKALTTFQSNLNGIDAWAKEMKLRWPTRQSVLNGIDNLGTCLVAAKKFVGP